MKRIVFFAAILLLVLIVYSTAQKSQTISFSKRWEKVALLADKQLPESALKEVDSILQQAQHEANSPEIIKAMVYKMRFMIDKDPDEVPELILNFETFTENSKNLIDKALLKSMTAELYVRFYQNDAWNIDRRSDIVGYVPANLREWTKNIFRAKIAKLLFESLENSAQLQQTPIKQYDTLLEKADDSHTLQPTLFDLLANRRIELLQAIGVEDKNTANEVLGTSEQVGAFQLKTNNIEAYMWTELNRLDFVRQQSDATAKDALYEKALIALKNKLIDKNVVVEVFAKLANYYLDTNSEDAQTNKMLAFDICSDGIRRFPTYKRISLLQNIQKSLKQQSISVSHPSVAYPFSDIPLIIKTENIKQLQLHVFRINGTALAYMHFKNDPANYNKIFPNRSLVATKIVTLQPRQRFALVDTTIRLQTNDYGIYELSMTDKRAGNDLKASNTSLVVSDFGLINRTTNYQSQDWYVLHRRSGKQQKGVRVAAYKRKWTGNGYQLVPIAKTNTNRNGLASVPFSSNFNEQILFLEKGKDCFLSSTAYAYYNENQQHDNESAVLRFLTDRSIYRPGQTVYFKGIAYFSSKNKQEVQKNASYEVTLRDANYQLIATKSYKTNLFGSFSGEFILPTSVLNGAYQLQAGLFSKAIYVEEYKRPTFEVSISKPKSEVRFGDRVSIVGHVKALAGYDLANAKVTYRISRHMHPFCWWWHEPDKEISTGKTDTDSDGNFVITFTPNKLAKTNTDWRGEFYSYTVVADVTDLKGETQQGEQTISVGDKSFFIIATVPDKIEKNEQASIPIYTETLNGEKINSTLNYELYRLDSLTDYLENKNLNTQLSKRIMVLNGRFNTADSNLKLPINKLKSAAYVLILKTKDAWQNEVKTEHTFIVYSILDKRPPVKCYEWLWSDNKTYLPGDKALIRFGTSTKQTPVLYEIMQGNKIIESKWLWYNDEIKSFEIPFQNAYGVGVTVAFTFMKNEKFFTEQIQLKRKISEKKLTPTLSVFRDKLQPGEKATWTINVPEMNQSAKVAEMLVGMYDASLDAIRPHAWDFYPVYRETFLASPVWNCAQNDGKSSDYAQFPIAYSDVAEMYWDKLNWFGLDLRPNRFYGRPLMMRGMKSKQNANAMMNEPVMISESLDVKGAAMMNKTVKNLEKQQESKPVQIRSNFAETAFFYPHLLTDDAGNVKFTFTAPESLTRWNVTMLAHTNDLYFGQGEAQAVTQKELMVQMNLPRFIRRSDKLMLSANVINLTDSTLKTNVTFELIDPATEKPIQLKDAAPKTLTLAANETKAVEWQVNEFSPYELVICKMVAQSDKFSDGEQKYLPVLPDNVLVTESMPMTVRGNKTRIFNFDNLIKNGSKVDTKNLSIEFSSNPSWYAVQALPAISIPESDNALGYFTAYYANSMAAFFANSNPKIATTFDRWKKAGGSREALLSNLQKNAELKNMLLDETPWVMAAKDETEQKQRIALLFDLNMQKNQNQQYLDKLLKLQTANGGFSWFEGMPESRYITQEIILNLGRLNKMVGGHLLSSNILPLTSALTYLDLEIAREYDYLKKYHKNYQNENCIGNMQLFYLHLRSAFPEFPIHVSAQEAVKFYSIQSEKYWNKFSLYGKAMTALVAFRSGKIKTANDILYSLKENALKTDELGMYWARNTAGYFWNERPIAVQAAIIEAFDEIMHDQKEIDEMKIWLLKQKQTQRWDSPLSTVNAIYALLYKGSDWLATEGMVSIKAGDKTMRLEKEEASTGYFKETIPVTEIRPITGKVTVSKSNNGIGWGAMYWQYYQDMDKIENQQGALKISKKLFVEKMTSSSKNLVPIEQVQLKKGDKVITRLVIATDRMLEFVVLKDLRAACFEPVNQLSGSIWKEGLGYYQTTKDASTQFFFNNLPKGTSVFEYEQWVNNSGSYSSGIATIQCLYAPEFVSHTASRKITIN
ncbi:MAG: hypothetical protein AUK44_07635 [Porphyromonadaceae bacterium CG2_30_38_12]|nr:MAG: hypothetical protein AUK44_07635 [Porphyromonadaceae bacterium CG2_30_38_12]